MKIKIDSAFTIAIRMGLIGGIVAVLIVLVGMFQAFSARYVVGGLLSMSQTLLLVTLFGVAYLAVRRSGSDRLSSALLVGAVSGVAASFLVVILVLFGQAVNLGAMFVSATPQVYDLLTFKLGLVLGSVALLAVGAAVGCFAASTQFLPSRVRRPIMTGLAVVAILGVLQDLVVVTFSNWPFLTFITRFLYVSNGLSIAGMVTLFVVTVALVYVWSERQATVKTRLSQMPPARRAALRWGSIAFGVVTLLLLPVILGLYLSEVLDMIGIYLLMGLGLNIVVGFAGLLDLGYVAFFAIGAYTVGFLTSPELGRAAIMTNWWAALPFALIMVVVFGVTLGIPVLKMRGDYLAIVTLGFGEIIRLLALSDLLKPYFGGAQGTRYIAKPDLGPLQIASWQPQHFYYIILAGCLLAIFVATRVKTARVGRAWMAMREDEDVAQAMGIDLVATKLLAFASGAFFGGLSGAIFASKLGSIFPHSFNFIISINVLSLIIIGGMGSIPGVVLGAVVLLGLPELLREFAEYRMLLYGAALVLMMLTRPEGLVPEARRKLELHEAELLAAESAGGAHGPGTEPEANVVGTSGE